MFLLVVLASSKLALLVRILFRVLAGAADQAWRIILLTVLVSSAACILGIQNFLLYQFQEDFNMSLHYFKTGVVLLTAVPTPSFAFLLAPFKHQEACMALSLAHLRALDDTARGEEKLRKPSSGNQGGVSSFMK